ncbi:MAG: DUF547 domain-containing protein [Thermodesulfobacteriota bacterium]|nr:DUF547 domain-containing protein [Thermodesulfobacteriota bacterium]
MRKTLMLYSTLFIFGSVSIIATSLAGNPVDHGLFAGLLGKYVRAGEVNYQGLKNDEGTLDAYLAILEAVDPQSLPRDEQFAFYANAYNAWTIKLILSGYPGVESIKDLGSLLKSPWKKKIARIDGKRMTLDQIEHDILRPRFKDPRVHFAINCAAKSCPPLSDEPFSGDTLDQQLDQLTRAFINDPNNNYLKGDVLYVSSIFKWFKTDFKDGIVNFFRKYAEGDLKTNLKAIENKIKVKYLDYDWSLNGK